MNSLNLFSSIVVLCIVIFTSTHTFSQPYKSVFKKGTLQWRPGSGQNGVEATIDYEISYGTFWGEPTELKVAKITKGNIIHFEGKTYTKAEVGMEAWEEISDGILDLSFDVYSGSRFVSTVTFKHVINFDMKGSPSWDDVFPGVNAEQTKSLFRQGFEIRNVRVASLTFSMYSIKKFAEEKEIDAEYDQLIANARHHLQQEEYEEALELFRSARGLKPDDSYAREQADQVALLIQKRKEEERINHETFNRLVTEGDQQLAAGNLEEALQAYENARATSPDNPEVEMKIRNLRQKINQKKEEERVANLQSYRENRNANIEQQNIQTQTNAQELRSSITNLGGAVGSLISSGISNNTDVNFYRGHSWHFSFNVGLDMSAIPVVTNETSKTTEFDGNHRALISSDHEIIAEVPIGLGVSGGLTFHPILSEYFGVGGFVQGTVGISPSILIGNSSTSDDLGASSTTESLTYYKIHYGGTASLGIKYCKLLLNYSQSINSIDYLLYPMVLGNN